MSTRDKSNIKIENEDSKLEGNEEVKESLRLIEDLKFFLATAPANWQENQVIRRYYLNHDEGFVSCIFWNNLYFVTGTDIVRCIVYKFQHFGRKIIDRKKFEEGIFSDLRNLKCGVDAVLEPPKSEFLEFLFKNSCLRTQKKQKVFFWFNVPHDKLMADALERDMKKEKMGQNPTTIAHREPAISFKYDEEKFLFNQLTEHMDLQKSLNETESETTASAEDNSPEYASSGNVNQERPEFDFLNQETPAQYKTQSDYEDDFPLDYFDSNDNTIKNSSDYITLDTNLHPQYANTIEENQDGLFEHLPSSYVIPTVSANQLVHNEEYLIEQTQSLKTPIPPLSATYQPKSAKYSRFPSSTEEHFPQAYQQLPLPAPLSRSFPNQYYNDPILIQQPPHATGIYHPDYNYIHPETEYYHNPMYEPAFQIHNQSGYVFMNDEFILHNDHFQGMNPNLMSAVPTNQHQVNTISYPHASSRQQAISANMMKKKNQMYQQQHDKPARSSSNSITKPTSTKRKINTERNLDSIVLSKSSRVVNFKREFDELSKGSDNENFIPTPESSVTHSEQNHHTNIN